MTNIINIFPHVETSISSANLLNAIDTLTPNTEDALCGIAVVGGLSITAILAAAHRKIRRYFIDNIDKKAG